MVLGSGLEGVGLHIKHGMTGTLLLLCHAWGISGPGARGLEAWAQTGKMRFSFSLVVCIQGVDFSLRVLFFGFRCPFFSPEYLVLNITPRDQNANQVVLFH